MVGLKLGLCLITLTLPLAFGGCAGALLVGGLAGVAVGGYAAAQERGVGGAVSDLPIETNVESAFAAIDPGLKDGITTTVYQGRVLLTGTVPTPQMKTRAVEVASRVSGIKALYDDIEVAPSRAAWDATNDAWITARIRSELMLDPDIRSGNYTIDTQKGSVYLIGSARSQAELERATRSARYIPGVKRVVTYVELCTGGTTANTFGRPRAVGHRLAIAARILSGLFQAHTLFHSRAHRFSEQQIILLSLSGRGARLAYGTPDSSAFWLAFGVGAVAFAS